MSKYKGRKCIQHLFEQKLVLPDWVFPPGTGNCTKCVPCAKNLECESYYPAPAISNFEVEADGIERDGNMDDTGGCNDGSSGDPTDNKAT